MTRDSLKKALGDNERIATVVIFIGSVAGVFYTRTLYPDVAWVPRFVLGLTGVLSILMFIRTFTGTREKTLPSFFIHMPRFFLITGFMLAYIVSVQYTGYFTATLFFLPVTALALGFRKKIMIMTTTLLYLIMVFLVFKQVFNLPFPLEFFHRWAG